MLALPMASAPGWGTGAIAAGWLVDDDVVDADPLIVARGVGGDHADLHLALAIDGGGQGDADRGHLRREAGPVVASAI